MTKTIGQRQRVFNELNESNWLTLRELHKMTGDAESSISAQMRNLRKKKFGSYIVTKRIKGKLLHNLWEYKLEGVSK